MRNRILTIIDRYEYKLQMAQTETEKTAYRLILGDLYDLLTPDDNTATITLNGVTVEVRVNE